jgi:acyl carrier protein
MVAPRVTAAPDALEADIRAFLRDELALNVGHITPETSLVTTGLLDSIAVVRLAGFLERRCGLRIPDRDVTPEHFETLTRIRAYLARRAAG